MINLLRSKGFAVVLAGGLLAAGASAQISKVNTGYQFRLKYSAGANLHYKLETGQTSGPLAFHVLLAGKDLATIQTTVGPFKAGDQSIPAQSYKVQVDSRGQVMWSKPSSTAADQLFFRLPINPVPINGVWTSKTNVNMLGGNVQFTTRNKLVGFKELNGKKVAVIQIVITGTGGAGVNGTGTAFLLVSDGTVYSSTTNVELMYNKGGEPTRVQSKLHMYRQ